jgi:hypothetical protein
MVFYDETGMSSDKTPALLEAELKEITDSIAARTKDPIWLIRVKPSFPSGVRAGVVVYPAPQQQTPRIRTGYAYSIPVLGEEIGISAPWKYVQVSKPEQTFSQQLALPSVADMPFVWPIIVDPNERETSQMPDDEVIRIADFVRQPSNYENSAIRRMPPKQAMAYEVQEHPVLSISRHGKAIDAAIGYQHNGLWGHGATVTLEQTPTGYRVVTWTMWVL